MKLRVLRTNRGGYMLRDNFYDKKVLAIYKCGSVIYGLGGEQSDVDYTVILDDFDGVNLINENRIDYFIYGYETFKKVVKFDDKNILHSFLMWTDNTLLAKENLVQIDASFEAEFNELIKVDWDRYFKKWLSINVDYFTAIFSIGINVKPLYNLYRIRSLVNHYKETGIFEFYLSENDRELIIDYKNNKAVSNTHDNNFKNILEYLRLLIAEEE